MSRSELSPRPEADKPFINVVHHPELLQQDVPYEVKVDASRCSEFLQEYGMNPRRIPRKKIVLRRTINHNPKYYSEVRGLQKKGRGVSRM